MDTHNTDISLNKNDVLPTSEPYSLEISESHRGNINDCSFGRQDGSVLDIPDENTSIEKTNIDLIKYSRLVVVAFPSDVCNIEEESPSLARMLSHKNSFKKIDHKLSDCSPINHGNVSALESTFRQGLKYRFTKGLTQQQPDNEEQKPNSTAFNRSRTENVMRKVSSNHELKQGETPFPIKKWIFCKICRLGLSQTLIMKAFKYLDSLSLNATKEVILAMVLEHIGSELDKKSQRKKKRSDLNSKPTEEAHLHRETSIETKIAEVEVEAEVESVMHDYQHLEPIDEAMMCQICFTSTKKKKLAAPLACEHEFCVECIKSYLEDCIMSFKVLNIKCPDEDCGAIFEDSDIALFLDEDVYKKYKRFKNSAMLNQNPNLRWCIRLGCENYMIGQPGSSYLRCPCGMEICFDCCNEYHPRKTCEEMIDEIYKEYAKKVDIQLCPKCKSRVEKDAGCNHIRCGVCGNEWCWLCGAPYVKHHYSLLNPFGCSGLQAGIHTKSKWPFWKLAGWRVMQVIMLVLLILVLPLIVTAALVLIPLYAYKDYLQTKKPPIKTISAHKSFLLILLGFLLFPLMLIICILYLIAWPINNCVAYMTSRNNDVSDSERASRNKTYGLQKGRSYYNRFMYGRNARESRQSEISISIDSDESISSRNRSMVVTID